MIRREFMKLAGGALAGAALGPADDRSVPVAMLGAPTASYRRMEASVSSRALLPAVRAHYQLARSVVTASPTAEGFEVLSEIAGFLAWLAYDLGDAGTARASYADAIGWADAAGHPLLVGYMQASLGHFAVDNGDANLGLGLLDRAHRHVARTAPPSAVAWLQSLRAIALAELSDTTAAHAALRVAERLAAKPTEPVWPFMTPFDQAKTARWRGAALLSLGQHRAAATDLGTTGLSSWAPKPRALVLIDQAHASAANGNLDQACDQACTALDLATAYNSERAITGVRTFRHTLPAGTTAATELDQRLAALYPTA
jgi:hypothetical protein